MIHLHIYFRIIYVDKFWFYIFVHLYFFIGMMKENGGIGHSDGRTNVRTAERGAGQPVMMELVGSIARTAPGARARIRNAPFG